MPSSASFSRIPRVFDNNLEKKFNYWTILMTSFIFFTVLSFYTFLLSLFGYFFRDEDDKDKDDERRVIVFLLFFVLWLVLLICLYIFLDNRDLLYN